MRPLFEHHYRCLLQEIYNLKRQDLPYTRELEGCFRIAYTHWRAVRTAVLTQGFTGPAEELHFYRQVKPLFTSRIAYYTLLYHSQLFQPEEDPLALHKFWLRESERLPRFLQTHGAFAAYYQAGSTHLDEWYFRPVKDRTTSDKVADDPDCEVSSPGDLLVATLLSLERYHADVQSQLQRLKTRAPKASVLPSSSYPTPCEPTKPWRHWSP